MEPIADALRRAREHGRPIAVPYVMVDRARGQRLGAVLDALVAAGATAVELGFPFSDPIADGPVLESAADRALAHRTGWADLLAQLEVASQRLPAAVMTYANPVWHHGLRAAFRQLADAGATGLIVPDLSFEDAGPWVREGRNAGVSVALLAAPAASPERVGRIAKASSAFLYMVSRYGTTGGSDDGTLGLDALVRAAHRAAPRLPVLVGFGVKDAGTARRARASGADGVIVGSALEERLARKEPLVRTASWFGSIVRA